MYSSRRPRLGQETRASARSLSSIQHDSTLAGLRASHRPRRRSSQPQQNRGGCPYVSQRNSLAELRSSQKDLSCLGQLQCSQKGTQSMGSEAGERRDFLDSYERLVAQSHRALVSRARENRAAQYQPQDHRCHRPESQAGNRPSQRSPSPLPLDENDLNIAIFMNHTASSTTWMPRGQTRRITSSRLRSEKSAVKIPSFMLLRFRQRDSSNSPR